MKRFINLFVIVFLLLSLVVLVSGESIDLTGEKVKDSNVTFVNDSVPDVVVFDIRVKQGKLIGFDNLSVGQGFINSVYEDKVFEEVVYLDCDNFSNKDGCYINEFADKDKDKDKTIKKLYKSQKKIIKKSVLVKKELVIKDVSGKKRVVDFKSEGYNCKESLGRVFCDSFRDGNGDGFCQGGETCCEYKNGEFLCLNGGSGHLGVGGLK